jgi:hypothetical protein
MDISFIKTLSAGSIRFPGLTRLTLDKERADQKIGV